VFATASHPTTTASNTGAEGPDPAGCDGGPAPDDLPASGGAAVIDGGGHGIGRAFAARFSKVRNRPETGKVKRAWVFEGADDECRDADVFMCPRLIQAVSPI
jgi:hypothetical protein